MIVSCPSCDKKFRLDDAKLAAGPVKLKCTGCETVFEVRGGPQNDTYRAETNAGQTFENLDLAGLKQHIAEGTIGPNDLVGHPDEPLAPASEHPDLAGVHFPEGTAPPGDDDLFGGGSDADEDDLFGGGSSDDDLFGGASDTSTDTDDLFGGDSAADTEEDLFGAASENDTDDDDLFGDAGDDDDLFADNSNDDDLFGDAGDSAGSSDDEDLFGDSSSDGDDDLFGDGPSDAAGSDDDLFASDDDDDDLFGDSSEAPSESSNDASSVFDEEIESESTGADDFFAEDAEGGHEYDEDIEQKLGDTPLDFSTPEPTAGSQIAFDDEDLGAQEEVTVAVDFDLPEIKTSHKGLYIGLAIFLFLGACIGSIFVVPDTLVQIPGVGDGVLFTHEKIQTTWYRNYRTNELYAQAQQQIKDIDMASVAKATALVQENQKIVRKSKQIQDYLFPQIFLAQYGGLIPRDTFMNYGSMDGTIGAFAKALEASLKTAPTGPYAPLVQAVQFWHEGKVQEASTLLEEEQDAAHYNFVRLIIKSELEMDLGSPQKALSTLEQALDIAGDHALLQTRIASVLWLDLDRKQQGRAQIVALEKVETIPAITSQINTLQTRVALSEDRIEDALKLSEAALAANSGNPDAVEVRAEALNRSGEAIKALLLLEDYVAGFPDHYGLQLQYGIAQQAMGKNDLAVAAFEAAIKINESKLQAPLRLSNLYSQSGEQDKALEIVQSLKRRFPSDPKVNLGLGALYLEQKEYGKAHRLLEEARKTDPRNARVLALLGRLYRIQGKLTQAADSLSIAIKESPDDIEVQMELGEVYLAQKKYEDSFKIYQTILADQPQNPAVLLALGKISYFKNDNKNAEDFLKEAVKNQISLHEGYYYQALLFRRQERLKEAEEAAEGAVKQRSDPDYMHLLADIHKDQRKPGSAMRVYEELLAEYPKNKKALWNSALLSVETGRENKAIEFLNALLAINPKDAKVYAKLAESFERTGDTEKAKSYVGKGLRQNPNSVDLLNVAGNLSIQEMDYQTAGRHLQRAVKLAPRNPTTRMLLGFYYKNGKNDLDKAELEFQRALKFGVPENERLRVEGELDALRYR